MAASGVSTQRRAQHQQVAQRRRARALGLKSAAPAGGRAGQAAVGAGAAALPGRAWREADQRPQLPEAADLRIVMFDHVAVVEDLRVAHRLGRRAEALDGDLGIRVEDAHPFRMSLLAHPGQHDRPQRPHLFRVAQHRGKAEARIRPDLVEAEVADEGPKL
jgi:hypothetical protein